MKPGITIFGAVLIFLIACNQQKTGTQEHQHNKDTAEAKAEEARHETTLVLNEGKKWKLDEATRQNMHALHRLVETFRQEPDLDYVQLAARLQASADKLVSECKMSGKDHDMLHRWLEKYFSVLRELKSADTKTQLAAWQAIQKQVRLFDEYFE
jgi:ribosome-binding protein aMBF1 (putative translation factor)